MRGEFEFFWCLPIESFDVVDKIPGGMTCEIGGVLYTLFGPTIGLPRNQSYVRVSGKMIPTVAMIENSGINLDEGLAAFPVQNEVLAPLFDGAFCWIDHREEID